MRLLLFGLFLARLPQAGGGIEILRDLQQRYSNAWYRTLAVIESVVYLDPASGRPDHAEVRYVSLDLPGLARRDTPPLEAGTTEILRNDSIFRFRGDTLVVSRPSLDPLQFLGFDVYLQPLSVTVSKLEGLGVDLGKTYEANFEGRGAYVIGASGPNESSNQLWIDKERLLVTRLQVRDPESGAIREVRFREWRAVDRAWVATEVAFLVNGRATLMERYAYWSPNVDLLRSLFAVHQRSRPAWVRR